MKLRPCKPKGLMTAEVLAIDVNGLHTARIKFQADILKSNLATTRERCDSFTPLEGNGPTGCGEDTDDVFMHRQSRIDIPHGKDGSVGVATAAEIKVSA